jgi:16S rRNA (uracil1498-N3)-methyltransferase
MADRYFSERSIEGDLVSLAGAEAHHLASVMRGKEGDLVILFDGGGNEFLARIQAVVRNRVDLMIVERRPVSRENPLRITLAVALPRGDRARWLVEKSVELGVHALVPLDSRRGVRRWTSQLLDRFRRAVIEASKQCGRNRLMAIGDSLEMIELVKSRQDPVPRFVAHPISLAKEHVAAWCSIHQARSLARSAGEAIIAIGPEGGFTDDEIELARAQGWRMLDLGPRILRVETAALLAAGLFSEAACDLPRAEQEYA